MENLKLSIIMPEYNEGKQIKKIIDKFISLHYENYELIIVDDGSTDCSSEILNEYSKKHNFIKIIHQKNQGCVFARKTGIAKAVGEFITFVDADDMVDENYFINFERAICNDADFYLLNNKLINPFKDELYIEKDFFNDGYIEKKLVERWVLTNKAGAVWDKIYKTSIIKAAVENLNLKIVFGDDIFINTVYLRNVDKIYCQNSSSYIHNRNSSTSVCKQYTFKKLEEIDVLASYILKNYDFKDDDLKNLFWSIVVYNYLETIEKLLRSNEKQDIYTCMNSLPSYKMLNEDYKPHGLKNKVYYYVLVNKMEKLMRVIFKIKNGESKI